ncbi:hypothetical protein I5R92_07245 [Pseudomonas carnis]|uniref:hypothetical protein n=1 Tax=Pseudomonas TaxID=286 RepID=UPI00091F8F1E|nr:MULTISPECIES: hypothetical protein [Pseudomonas]MBH3367079.1 hypothetical protein [Pseudomonas carnis]MDE1528451.1 hypothetical protein [Pseudomonas carnis]OKO49330.1 hypothetical protein BMH52_05615 [Pseudomonas sp. BTN1]SFX08920.1 hypothetical protein SAMN03159316_0699 [Pseudomonas sp. NFR02]
MEAKGTVIAYDWIRKEWLIVRDDGEEVFIDVEDWHQPEFSVGERMRFQMIQRPLGVYALPVNAVNAN